MLHQLFSHRQRAHVAVAGFALHLGADVGRVLETDVGVLFKSVDALPGDVFPRIEELGHFLDFR